MRSLFREVEVTISLSNIIKAAAITYTEEKRMIDSNPKAEEFTRLFVQKHAQAEPQPEETGTETVPEDGFTPGLAGIFVDRSELPEQQVAAEPEIDVEEATRKIQEQAEEILAQAREEVKSMLAQAEIDAEAIRKNAFAKGQDQGYKEGNQKATAELENAKKRLAAEQEKFREEYEKQVEQLEPAFVEVVIGLVRKLTGVLLEDKKGIILYLLEQAMSETEPSASYLIHVSSEEYEMVVSRKQDLQKRVKEGAVVEIIEDRMMSKGQCVIETDSRIFDCGLDTQMKNLLSELKMLA